VKVCFATAGGTVEKNRCLGVSNKAFTLLFLKKTGGTEVSSGRLLS
jgi:hypothetical protein